MLIDKTHLGWGLATRRRAGRGDGGLCVVGRRAAARPSGGSVAGLTFGILSLVGDDLRRPAGGAEEVSRPPRWGSAQFWLRVHIWLGLLSVPLALFHSGFRFGGTLEKVFMIVFFVVIASGVYGLALQQVLAAVPQGARAAGDLSPADSYLWPEVSGRSRSVAQGAGRSREEAGASRGGQGGRRCGTGQPATRRRAAKAASAAKPAMRQVGARRQAGRGEKTGGREGAATELQPPAKTQPRPAARRRRQAPPSTKQRSSRELAAAKKAAAPKRRGAMAREERRPNAAVEKPTVKRPDGETELRQPRHDVDVWDRRCRPATPRCRDSSC